MKSLLSFLFQQPHKLELKKETHSGSPIRKRVPSDTSTTRIRLFLAGDQEPRVEGLGRTGGDRHHRERQQQKECSRFQCSGASAEGRGRANHCGDHLLGTPRGWRRAHWIHRHRMGHVLRRILRQTGYECFASLQSEAEETTMNFTHSANMNNKKRGNESNENQGAVNRRDLLKGAAVAGLGIAAPIVHGTRAVLRGQEKNPTTLQTSEDGVPPHQPLDLPGLNAYAEKSISSRRHHSFSCLQYAGLSSESLPPHRRVDDLDADVVLHAFPPSQRFAAAHSPRLLYSCGQRADRG